MFVKVTVGYEAGSSSSSSPLDLLLYDSQCWHCSLAGECNARPNNKCVFSAAGGSSSVQTFRIGKSITNSEGIVTSCQGIVSTVLSLLRRWFSRLFPGSWCWQLWEKRVQILLQLTGGNQTPSALSSIVQFQINLLISTNLLTDPLSLYKTPPKLNIIWFQFS